jgi:hypothetical protein
MIATYLLFFVVCAYEPNSVVAIDTYDYVETNHVYDADGKHVLSQWIYYDWSPRQRSFLCQAFRVIRDRRRPRLFYDGPLLRRIRATSRRETWTQYDPELVNREVFPKELRRGLTPR